VKSRVTLQKKIHRCLYCNAVVCRQQNQYVHINPVESAHCIFKHAQPISNSSSDIATPYTTHTGHNITIYVCEGVLVSKTDYDTLLNKTPPHHTIVFLCNISAWTAYTYKGKHFLVDISTIEYNTKRSVIYYRYGKQNLVRVFNKILRMRRCGPMRYVKKVASVPEFDGIMQQRIYPNTWTGIERGTFTPVNIAAAYILDTIHRQNLCGNLSFEGTTWVDAPAGGGKTTLLLSIIQHYKEKKFLFLTFSKALQLEMEARRIRVHVDNMVCYTIDAYIRERLIAEVNGTDTAAVNEQESEDDEEDLLNFAIEDIYTHMTEDPNAPEERQQETFGPVTNLTDFFLNRQILKKPYNRPRGVAQVVECIVADRLLKMCKVHQQCQIDKRILPTLKQLKPYYTFTGARHRILDERKPLFENAPYDMIVVDEYQDMDLNMRSYLQEQGLPILFVGDGNQEIYQFRTRLDRCKCLTKTLDHDTSAAQKAHRTGTAITLYRSFRSPMSHIYFLMAKSNNRYLGCGYDYTTRRDTTGVHVIPENAVINMMGGKERWQPNIVLLVRTRFEILSWFLVLIRADVRNVRVQDPDRFLADIQEARAKTKDTNFDNLACSIKDKLYLRLTERLEAGSTNPVHPLISTVHGYKGLENKHVITSLDMLTYLQSTDNAEERNIAYVAMTRAKRFLFLYKPIEA
jgi:hypothetical protein